MKYFIFRHLLFNFIIRIFQIWKNIPQIIMRLLIWSTLLYRTEIPHDRLHILLLHLIIHTNIIQTRTIQRSQLTTSLIPQYRLITITLIFTIYHPQLIQRSRIPRMYFYQLLQLLYLSIRVPLIPRQNKHPHVIIRLLQNNTPRILHWLLLRYPTIFINISQTFIRNHPRRFHLNNLKIIIYRLIKCTLIIQNIRQTKYQLNPIRISIHQLTIPINTSLHLLLITPQL